MASNDDPADVTGPRERAEQSFRTVAEPLSTMRTDPGKAARTPVDRDEPDLPPLDDESLKIVEKFEAAWEGERPELRQYFDRHPERPIRLLLELAVIDLENRIRRGEPAVPEEYFSSFPQIASTPSCVRELQRVADNRKWTTEVPVSRVGDYEIIAPIGDASGMGVVYKARHTKLDRLVAIKMPIRGGSDVARFRAEAKAAAQLEHPGIVPIFDVGEENGRPYFAMGLVQGGSLARRVTRQGPLSPRDAAALVRAVAEAVHYAHERGVIHRDLKPANILLTQDGAPKLTDFGIAKRMESASDLTREGQILGTPSYMPPEQADPAQAKREGAAIDATSDVYSLGGVLYFTLTGHPPFLAGTHQATLRMASEAEPVPPRRLNPQIDRDLETITLKCLEKGQHQRYASAADLAADLGRFLAGEPIRARPVSPLERTVNPSGDAAPGRHPMDADGVREITELSAERARELVALELPDLSLDSLATMTPEVAGILTTHEGGLSLKGLRRLGDDVAAALSRHAGALSLDGLETLTPTAAERLAAHESFLYLDGITSLSDAAAAALSRHSGPLLSLAALSEISPDAARSLSRHRGRVEIGRLAILPSAAWARDALRRHGGQLDHVKSLSREAAWELASHEGPLSLNGLESAADEVIVELSRHSGRLSLKGLRVLSPRAARKLLQHKGGLVVGDLQSLHDTSWTKATLRKHGGHLEHVTELAPEAAVALAAHEGPLSLDGLADPAEPVLAALVPHTHALSLRGIGRLTPATAAVLARHAGCALSLDGLRTLDPEIATLLAQYKGNLSFNGVTALDPDVASRLASHGLGLSFEGLTAISPETADALVPHTGMLFLDGLVAVPVDAARSLARYEGVMLSLGRLQDLPDDVAAALAAYRGVLSLTGVRTLSEASARLMAARSARVVLTGLAPLAPATEAVLRASDVVELGSPHRA
jgi:serine/threonine protein kinase